jgi:integrase
MSTGTGTVYQRQSDGRWVASVRLANRKRVVRYATTEREARQHLKLLLGQQHTGALTTPSRMTFQQWSERWMELVSARCRPSTVEDYEYGLRPLLDRFGLVRLDRLTPVLLVHAIADMQRRGLGPGRVASSYNVLNICLRQAVKLDVLASNPLDRVDRPRGAPKERRFWTAEECQRFIEVAEASRHHYAPLLLFLLSTGMRRGEALGLNWADIDRRTVTARVERSLVFVRNEPRIQDVKTRAGRRTVALPALAVCALGRVPQAIDESSPIFRSSTGGVPFPMRMIEALRSLCRRAEVPVISVHGLRHVHAALLVRQGVDLHSLRRRLGHTRVDMSLWYAYAVGSDGEAAAAFDRALLPDGSVEAVQ